jgi:hypothetical protein
VLYTLVYGVLVVGGVCLLALAGLELVQRLVPASSRQPHNDVAGFIYAALGVIYAVLIALVVIAVWEEYGAAQRNRRAGGQRGGRHLLAGRPASGGTGHPPPGAPAILRPRGGR